MARKPRALTPQNSVASSLNLASFRQKKTISLEQIAEATKISIRFLRAIEDEEFEKLPGGIFNTSYLRQYAAAVGFDETKLLNYYNRRVNPAPAQEVVARPLERSLFDRWFRIPAHAPRSS